MNKKQVFMCIFGTIMEWYDFSIFASLAAVIATIFFPKTNVAVATMWTFVIFASGFLTRPLGALFFGHLADRIGRKFGLLATITLMAIATTAIGLIPLKAGMSAVILLVICRLAQGFACSGEYAGGISLLFESAPANRRGFYASFGVFSSIAGIFLGSLVCSLTIKLLSQTTMLSWGWRIPFLLGLPLGLLGFYLRRALAESTLFLEAKQRGHLVKIPFMTLLKSYFKPFITLFCIYVFLNVTFYISFIYLPDYAISTHHLGLTQAFYNNTGGMLLYACLIPCFGYLADKINAKSIMVVSILLLMGLAIPAFHAVFGGNPLYQFAGQTLLLGLLGMFDGPLGIFSTSIFPTEVRCTGVGAAVNLSASIFGGTTPLICTWLSKVTHNPIAPAFYLIATGGLALGVCIAYRYTLSTTPLSRANANHHGAPLQQS